MNAEEQKQADRLKLLEQIADSTSKLAGYSKFGYPVGQHAVNSCGREDSEDLWEDIFQLLHRLDLVDLRDTNVEKNT